MGLRRDQLINAIGNDPITIKIFERVLNNVSAAIAGPSAITLDYTSTGTLVTPLPAIYRFTLSTGDGTTFPSGVSWGVTVLSGTFDGAEPTAGGTGTGILQLNSGLATNTVVVAMTARANGQGYPPFTVTLSKNIAPADNPSGGGTASDSTTTFTSISTGVFAPVTRDLSVTLPAAVTSATLTAVALSLRVSNASPDGTTAVEVKWQRETAPAVWSDVGLAATSLPECLVTAYDEPGLPTFYIAEAGEVTCNRTETAMPAASAQKFRLVGRVSSGNVRNVVITGTASVSS